MAKTSKRQNIAVWKIDESFLVGTTPDAFVSQLKKDANTGLAEDSDKRLKEIKLDSEKVATLGASYIKLLRRKRDSPGWYDFIAPVLSNDYAEGKLDSSYGLEQFSSERVDLILFVGLGDDKLYCVSAGAGYYMVERYVDDTYSFDVVRQMFVGEVKEARSRAITGQKFAETVSYRNDYGINSSEAFGKIWKQLRGPLDKEFIKSRTILDKLIDVNRSPQAEAKASFTLKKSLNIQDLVAFVKELDVIARLPLTDEKRQAFRFLDMAHPVRNAELKAQLQDKFFSMMYKDVNENSSQCYEFDFCHPKSVSEFFGADKHSFQVGHADKCGFDLDGASVPQAKDIIESLRDVDAMHTDEASFKKIFKKITYRIKPNESDDWIPISAPLWQYFHGEIQHNDITYFLVDKIWYMAKTDFLDALKDYFRETIEEDDVIQNSINFQPYPAKDPKINRDNRENRFNLGQSGQDNFWYGDMQYGRYGRGEVELFDLLYDSGDKTYVIQTKEGFAGTMRDACSQIKMSAQAIHGDSRNKNKMLKAYYKKWSDAGHSKGLSEQDFLKLFAKKRLVFVIAAATKHDLTMDNLLDDTKFYSHIAKFEAEALTREFRGNKWTLEIHRIVDAG